MQGGSDPDPSLNLDEFNPVGLGEGIQFTIHFRSKNSCRKDP